MLHTCAFGLVLVFCSHLLSVVKRSLFVEGGKLYLQLFRLLVGLCWFSKVVGSLIPATSLGLNS